jgi:hypothetical protein
MNRLGKTFALALILAVAPAAALAASSPVAGSWRKLPAAGIVVNESLSSVWTGKQLIVFGRQHVGTKRGNVAATYDPTAGAWHQLTPPRGETTGLSYRGTLWTGKEMLAWAPFEGLAFNPATNEWRTLRHSLPGGIIVWTGSEAIGWGGGCCGDAWSNGAAYNPATDTFRKLARSPLAPSQGPVGAWTGRELVLFVSGYDPDGKRYPARFARAAAYNPTTNTWRRIAPLPEPGGTAAWDGREVLVVSGGAHSQSALAYNPATNRWRRLASLPTGRFDAAPVWTGKRLLLWGGEHVRTSAVVRGGLAYNPRTNRWSVIPPGPLKARGSSAVAWTGRALIVWGGEIGTPLGTSIPPRYPADGAVFTPMTP